MTSKRRPRSTKAPETSATLPPGGSLKREGLSAEQTLWLEHVAETDDRIAACKAVGIRWADLRRTWMQEEAFRAAYDEAMSERFVTCEDMIYRAAREGGSPAAKAYLATYGPKGSEGDDEEIRAAAAKAALGRLNGVGAN